MNSIRSKWKHSFRQNDVMIRRLPTVAVPFVAALAAATLALSGCQLLPSPTPPAPVPVGAEEYYSQTLNWEPCGENEDQFCASATAPIDWDAPAEGTIELAVIKQPASGTKQGSLLINPGGPGGSGWDSVYYGGANSVSADVAEVYDVIGWDPRGVGQSTPVECYTSDAEVDDLLYGTYASPYGTSEWLDELTVVQQDFAAACLENTGALLGHLDAASNARDMDMLRAVLGDEKLNYLGYSYGTFFGAVYAALFPQNVGRLVLDGAVDPLVGDAEALIVQMAGFDSAFRAYMEFCLDGEGCPFTGGVDEALLQARDVLEAADARGLVNADGRVFDSATLGTAIAGNLYSETYWQDMTDMFVALNVDDPSLSFLYADYYNTRLEDGTYDGNGTAVYIAASCADGDFVTDDSTTLERIDEIDAAAPILGKFFAYDDFAVLDTACTNWPVPAGDLPTNFEALGAAPILVIGTTNDPATPYANSVSLANQLSSGVLISYEGEGHTIYNQGVSCIDDVVGAFFVSGVVPTEDPDC